jgi:DNA-binding NtrC family response regulator
MRILDDNASIPETLEVVGKLKTLLKAIPEIYVSQYDSNNRIITAIYRGDTDFIEIPIGFTRTSAVGRYVGKFKRNTCMTLDKESGE